MMQNIFRDLESGHMETGQGQILEATVKIAHTLLARKNMQPVFPPCWIIGSFEIIDLQCSLASKSRLLGHCQKDTVS